MERLVLCVPNFSEGREVFKVEQILSAIRSIPHVFVLNLHKDPDHHRCVVSFVASPEEIVLAAFLGASKAAELINLNDHDGGHPRIGATDVIPFIPISSVSIKECVELANKLGMKIAVELGIPVYLYEKAATRPERANITNLRKGQFEILKTEIETNPDRAPDFGNPKVHPTAGAAIVGVRDHIINFNVNLLTQNLEAGRGVAQKIRASSGGFPYLRAKEIFLKSRGMVQVSCVLSNYKAMELRSVFQTIQKEVKTRGVRIDSTEIVGLIPQEAMRSLSPQELKLKNFNPSEQILESALSILKATDR